MKGEFPGDMGYHLRLQYIKGEENKGSGVSHFIKAAVFSIVLLIPNPIEESNSNTLYYGDFLRDAGYEIVNEEGFNNFLDNFSPILEYLDRKGMLIGEDINRAMNIYSALKKYGIHSIEYSTTYDDLIGGFTNPDLDIIGVLAKNGYPYGDI